LIGKGEYPMEESYKKIGLIAAMQSERSALLKLVKNTEKEEAKLWRFQTPRNDCWLIESGMGWKAAAKAARDLLEKQDVQALVSFGIAGAVHSDLHIGDVILAYQACLLEGVKPAQFLPLTTLPDAARQAVEGALHPLGARLLNGIAVTTTGAQVLDAQDRKLENPILEMETHSIARVAHEYGVPLYALRSISDSPEAPIPFDLGAVMDDQFHFRTDKIIAEVIRHPAILKPGVTMLRNSGIACDHAALAVLVVLEQAPL
jgi:adenosylhomocysteine nucleosidase